VGPNFDFNKPEDRNKVLPLAGALTEAVAMRDGAAFIAFLDAQPQTNKKAKAGVQGYCMGGPLTLRTAAAVPARVGGAATFHGGGLATANPDSPHLLAPKMKANLLIAVADNDDMREPQAKVTLKQALDAAKLTNKVEVYAGAQHGWCVKGSAVYNEASAEKAWAELTALYKTALV
jgi:carboxymethylenebutenolidase